MNRTIGITASVAAIAAGLALTGCAADPTPAAQASAPPGETARYCAIVAEVNGIGERIFADLPEDAPPEEIGRREGMLVDQTVPQFAEMKRIAPPEIRADVTLFLADLDARETNPDGTGRQAAEAAEQRIRAFDDQNCALGPDGS